VRQPVFDERLKVFARGRVGSVDALLDRPIKQILSNVLFAAEDRATLTGGSNRFPSVYETLLACEQAD
jgi:hypothetical protein